MALVKAKMAFYHDAVGTRAMNETFEVKNEQVCAQLEQAGYVQKVEGQEAQMHQEQQNLQQQVGQRNALTNEAVSLASHVQNQQAAQAQQNFGQARQQAAQHAAQNTPQSNSQAAQAQQAEQLRQEAAHEQMTAQQAKAKKADK